MYNKSLLNSYSLINMRQLHISSIKPILEMGLHVDFCVFTWIWLNLPDQNLKLFCFDIQDNFTRQIQSNLCKNTELNKQSCVEFRFNRKKYGAVLYSFSCITAFQHSIHQIIPYFTAIIVTFFRDYDCVMVLIVNCRRVDQFNLYYYLLHMRGIHNKWDEFCSSLKPSTIGLKSFWNQN